MMYLLDTNVASDIFSGRSRTARLALDSALATSTVAISVLTEAELLFGFSKRPEATRLRTAFDHFCTQVKVLSWDSHCAQSYGELRNRLNTRGINLDAIDILIASHAFSLGAKLVTRDKAFDHVFGVIECVNWATDLKQPQ